MGDINSAQVQLITDVRKKIEDNVKGSPCLAEAAQSACGHIYETFKESIVLARIFATVQFDKLPSQNQKFVNELAGTKGIADLIDSQTLVLSLLGSRGEDPAWNDRHHSKGHVGIPLASGAFINKIPMMSRLLNDLGLGLGWIDSKDRNVFTRTTGKMGGVFHVLDAASAEDALGRKIIADQTFVDKHKVKTVFGVGGGYILGNTFIVLIIFCRDSIPRQRAELFVPIINSIKTATAPFVSRGDIF